MPPSLGWDQQRSSLGTLHGLYTVYTRQPPPHPWLQPNHGTHKGFVLIDPSKDRLRYLGTQSCVGKVIVNQPPTDYVESLVSLGSHTYVIRGVNPMQVRSRVFQRSCRVAS
ncbi:hypothetical protein MKW98_010010 [Papaver atlanticum]|uniref:Uncharacterized protein n=1 Tax=Papaver atlanticum TaxID=357466 RepID=A0AAD4RXA8_9MAGN|nr:hypothetical protein MKW98_010010 [Papaver atlanticum]